MGSINMGERKLDISFEPTYENADMAREAVMGICRGIGSGAFADELELAITEAINNSIGLSGSEKIRLELICGSESVVFRLITAGDKFSSAINLLAAGRVFEGELPESAYGIKIINDLFDSVKYEHDDGTNALTLEKNIINTVQEG